MSTLLQAAGLLYLLAALLLSLGLRRARRRFDEARARIAASAAEPEPMVVVAAARDEAESLPDLLDALDALDYPPGRLEVVIVDDGSRDDTPRILARFVPGRHAFRSLRLDLRPEHGSPKKEALRRGIASADAPLVLLTDADTTPPPGWARAMGEALSGGCPVVAGHSPSRPRRGLLGWYAGLWELGSSALAGAFIGLGVPLHVIGRNWGFRREVFEAAGGYAGLESALSGDDALLAQKLAAAAPPAAWGFSLAPGTQVHTHPSRDWGHFLGQRRRHVATGKRFRPLPLLIAACGFIVFALLWAALVTLPWGFCGPGAAVAVGLKIAADTLFLAAAGLPAGEMSLAVSAPLFSVLHLLLFPLLQLAGTLLPFHWKGRRGR